MMAKPLLSCLHGRTTVDFESNSNMGTGFFIELSSEVEQVMSEYRISRLKRRGEMKLFGLDISSRLNNYGLWVSLAALFYAMLQLFDVGVPPERLEMLVNSLLGLLLALGILSDPTTRNRGFRDD
jgi:uncharacterized membrane protein